MSNPLQKEGPIMLPINITFRVKVMDIICHISRFESDNFCQGHSPDLN